jgi:hypothetical protein
MLQDKSEAGENLCPVARFSLDALNLKQMDKTASRMD